MGAGPQKSQREPACSGAHSGTRSPLAARPCCRCAGAPAASTKTAARAAAARTAPVAFGMAGSCGRYGGLGVRCALRCGRRRQAALPGSAKPATGLRSTVAATGAHLDLVSQLRRLREVLLRYRHVQLPAGRECAGGGRLVRKCCTPRAHVIAATSAPQFGTYTVADPRLLWPLRSAEGEAQRRCVLHAGARAV